MRETSKRRRTIFSLITLCILLSSGTFAFLAYAATTSSTGTKLEHIIFVIQENHSFDNYFGVYPGANGLASAPPCCNASLSPSPNGTDMVSPYHLDLNQPVMIVGDELPPGQMFPNASDTMTPAAGDDDDSLPFNIPNETNVDLNHAWQAAFTDWNYGKMNGFLVGEGNNETMGYFDRSDIPYYYDYADNFVLDDEFFSSMMGPSFPNHLYIASGSSGNGTLANPHDYPWIVNGSVIGNPPTSGSDLKISVDLSLTWTALAQELTQHSISWKWYTGAQNVTAPSYWDVLPVFKYFQQNPSLIKQNVVGTQNFVNSVQNGTLPSVSWVIPGGSWTPPVAPFTDKPAITDCVTSEHPPARPDCGMDYVSYLVNAVMKSSYWDSTAIVITWDDYGGFYDQVPPPQTSGQGEGFRVPTLVVSPYAKHGFIDNTPYEFGSFLSLVEANFNLPSLGARDSVGIGRNNMMNSFNFSQPPQPPVLEPGKFIGPATVAPVSNGYPKYNGGGTSSSTSSTSSITSISSTTSSPSSTILSSSSTSTSLASSTSTTSASSTPSSTSTSSLASSTSPPLTSTMTTSSTQTTSVAPTGANDEYEAVAVAAVVVAVVAAAYFARRRRS